MRRQGSDLGGAMRSYRSSSPPREPTLSIARIAGASSPEVIADDPRLPRVDELVALRWSVHRLWVGQVRSAYDQALSVALDTMAPGPAEPKMPEPGAQVALSGLAGIPIDARGTVRGHTGPVVLLKDVTAGEERPEQAKVSVGSRGRLWCEDRAGTGCGVEVLDRFPDGLCISAPAGARPGDRVSLAGPVAVGGPVPAILVGCREGRHRRALAYVAFLTDPSDARVRSLLAGLADER
jgi:hypothetical protein